MDPAVTTFWGLIAFKREDKLFGGSFTQSKLQRKTGTALIIESILKEGKMTLPNLHATDPTLTMVGWRYHLTKPCPALLAQCAGENVVRTLVIPKDQLITVTEGPFNDA